MRRHHYIGIQRMDQAGSGTNHIGADLQLKRMPRDVRMAINADLTPPKSLPQMGIEPRKFSLSERQLRAAAFAARVHNLKYYIGLIGAKSII